jgi:hypothetical protein
MFASCLIISGFYLAERSAARLEYTIDLDRRVGLQKGLDVYIGKLDRDGDFKFELFHADIQNPSTGFPIYEVINISNCYPYKTYEFRSGKLISGSINSKLLFEPDIGGKIIRFEDYKYMLGSPKIWNFPGRLQPNKGSDER